MDISKDLKDVKEGKTYLSTIISDLEAQKEDISKRIHLFKVVNLISVIEEFLQYGAFEENDIQMIQIWNKFDDDKGYKIYFEYYDKEGDLLIRFGDDGNYIEPVMSLQSIFYDLEGYNSSYVGEKFKENAVFQFEMKEGCEEKFIDLLLSKELKASLQHSMLQNAIEKRDTPTKRPKI
jgi:hypothetical protein